MAYVNMKLLGHEESSIAMLLLFGTCACLLGMIELGLLTFSHEGKEAEQEDSDPEASSKLLESNKSENSEAKQGSAAVSSGAPKVVGKKLSKPLEMTVPSVRELLWELTRFGLLIGFAWLCEYHPLFPHSEKYWERDQYYFLCLLLLLYSLMDIHKSKGNDVLNREQTEEWKGWMQFMFLLYHYYKAEEVYNSIRVMITCYVWMTGFGNFSFFYVKRDFGFVRVVQMLWRLNFLVLALCMVMGNTYILYYICPLHTFFFLMVYVTMYIGQEFNHQKWGVRAKVMVLGVIIFLTWDLPRTCLFKYLFGFILPTSPVIGATGGTLWEWYFRTTLDHWSTFLGMIFALNFPIMTQWFVKVEEAPATTRYLVKGVSGAVMFAIGAWWCMEYLPLQKFDYNASNPYFAFIPLLVYVFLRNITPGLRHYYLGPLHAIGKTTLETYLMQHHVWLTSNAKTLVTIVPGYPKINFLIVSVMFLLIAKELYRLTMSLRGMLLPDNLRDCWINLTFITGFVGMCYGLACLIFVFEVEGPVAFVCVILSLSMACMVYLRSVIPHSQVVRPSSRNLVITIISLFVVFLSLNEYMKTHVGQRFMHSALLPPPKVHGPPSSCIDKANVGYWKTKQGCEQSTGCVHWEWYEDVSECSLHEFEPSEAVELTESHHDFVFVGDSIARNVYYAVARAMGDTTQEREREGAPKHSDIACTLPSGASLRFYWAPYAANLTDRLPSIPIESGHTLLLTSGLWDALHVQSKERFQRDLSGLMGPLDRLRMAGSRVVWLENTAIVDSKLSTEEKKQHMTSAIVASYRQAAKEAGVPKHVSGYLLGYDMTGARASDSLDGVHYADFVYDGIAQVLLNQASLLSKNTPRAVAPAAPQHEVCEVANPWLGLWILGITAVMLLTMDNFFGIPMLVVSFLGGSDLRSLITWDNSYVPLHKKLRL